MFFSNVYFNIFICIYLVKLGSHLVNHGKKEELEYNFYKSLFATALGILVICMAIKTGI